LEKLLIVLHDSFGFVPNLGLGVAGLILYAIPMLIFIASKSSFSPKPLFTLSHPETRFTDWFRYGRQRYMLALTIGSFFMVVGWGCRVAWHYMPGSTAVYIPETLVSTVNDERYIMPDAILYSSSSSRHAHSSLTTTSSCQD
jgi:hypothetical protein